MFLTINPIQMLFRRIVLNRSTGYEDWTSETFYIRQLYNNKCDDAFRVVIISMRVFFHLFLIDHNNDYYKGKSFQYLRFIDIN